MESESQEATTALGKIASSYFTEEGRQIQDEES